MLTGLCSLRRRLLVLGVLVLGVNVVATVAWMLENLRRDHRADGQIATIEQIPLVSQLVQALQDEEAVASVYRRLIADLLHFQMDLLGGVRDPELGRGRATLVGLAALRESWGRLRTLGARRVELGSASAESRKERIALMGSLRERLDDTLRELGPPHDARVEELAVRGPAAQLLER